MQVGDGDGDEAVITIAVGLADWSVETVAEGLLDCVGAGVTDCVDGTEIVDEGVSVSDADGNEDEVGE